MLFSFDFDSQDFVGIDFDVIHYNRLYTVCLFAVQQNDNKVPFFSFDRRPQKDAA